MFNYDILMQDIIIQQQRQREEMLRMQIQEQQRQLQEINRVNQINQNMHLFSEQLNSL